MKLRLVMALMGLMVLAGCSSQTDGLEYFYDDQAGGYLVSIGNATEEEEIVVPEEYEGEKVVGVSREIRLNQGGFAGTENLKRIVLPETITTIERRAFVDSSVEEVKFRGESKLFRIERDAFRGSSLKSFTLPASVYAIEDYAFYNNDLKELIVERPLDDGLVNLSGSMHFNIHSDLTIYVDDDAVDTYRRAEGWSRYAGMIEPISERD